MDVSDKLAKVRRETERVAEEHELKPYFITDREWELAAREARLKFDKYRKERGLDKET